MKRISIIITTGIVILVSCSKKTTDVATPAPTPAPVVKDTSTSYAVAVKPLTDKYCISCHSNHSYIEDLNSYAALKAVSDAGFLKDRLYVKKDMPPYGSPQPTKADLDIIKKWISDGCKE